MRNLNMFLNIWFEYRYTVSKKDHFASQLINLIYNFPKHHCFLSGDALHLISIKCI